MCREPEPGDHRRGLAAVTLALTAHDDLAAAAEIGIVGVVRGWRGVRCRATHSLAREQLAQGAERGRRPRGQVRRTALAHDDPERGSGHPVSRPRRVATLPSAWRPVRDAAGALLLAAVLEAELHLGAVRADLAVLDL